MSYEVAGRRRPTKTKKQARGTKRKRDDVDTEKLSTAVAALDPVASVDKFTDLPLSEPTKVGLKHSHFTTLTDIQRQTLPTALLGRDILGAARTGSGKTLAFLIPVLENLYRAQCVGPDAGLGAMIIAPTRELAIQIFDVLRAIGKYGHLFAAGLIIGGKSLQDEQEALARMNIVVCTPGRMLQHLSQTSSFAFGVDSLRILVLDEADRIMDLGFQKDIDAIIEYLPPDRQTLLFSATQTKRVADLARLSLRDPAYIAVHSSTTTSATPTTLQQNYVLTPLPLKISTLWSFLQTAKKSKTLVFLSSGKQVRYLYEALRKLQPGISLLHLHGRQKQTARLDVTARFSTTRAACLFATDIAARGLDFPAVDWVVQLDCPEDAVTYIHRVGRTARYQRDGRAVLFLDPAEEAGMLARLSKARVPIERISVRPSKMANGGAGISHQLAALCFKDPSLKYLGQKAFASYVRSLHIQKDKEIFELERYGDRVGGLAEAMGLPGTPRIRFAKGDVEEVRRRKNAPREVRGGASDDEGEEKAVRTKYDRMFGRKNQDVLAPHYAAMIEEDDDQSNKPTTTTNRPNGAVGDDNENHGADGDGDDDELFTIKTRFVPPPPSDPDPDSNPTTATTSTSTNGTKPPQTSKTRAKNALTRPRFAKQASASLPGGLANLASTLNAPNHLVFDSDDDTGEGRARRPFAEETLSDDNEDKKAEQRVAFMARERERMRDADAGDRVAEKERRRAKKEKRKAKARERGGLDSRPLTINDDSNNNNAPNDADASPPDPAEEGDAHLHLQEEQERREEGEEGLGAFDFPPLQQGTPFAELADLFPSDNNNDDNGRGGVSSLRAPVSAPTAQKSKLSKVNKKRSTGGRGHAEELEELGAGAGAGAGAGEWEWEQEGGGQVDVDVDVDVTALESMARDVLA